MNEGQVSTMIAALRRRYPDMPMTDREERVWVESFAPVDRDLAYAAVNVWCRNCSVWPVASEIHSLVARAARVMKAQESALPEGQLDLGLEPDLVALP